jgi:hypothetical protein
MYCDIKSNATSWALRQGVQAPEVCGMADCQPGGRLSFTLSIQRAPTLHPVKLSPAPTTYMTYTSVLSGAIYTNPNYFYVIIIIIIIIIKLLNYFVMKYNWQCAS